MTDNKELKTPSGNVVILKSHLTGLERRMYRRSLLNIDEAQKALSLEAVEDASIAACVISLDGSPDNLLERILGLDDMDYTFILDEVNELIQGLTKKKEKISDGNGTIGSKEN